MPPNASKNALYRAKIISNSHGDKKNSNKKTKTIKNRYTYKH